MSTDHETKISDAEQAGYDAVWALFEQWRESGAQSPGAAANARVWRAVQAALRAAEPVAVQAGREAAAQAILAACPDPVLHGECAHKALAEIARGGTQEPACDATTDIYGSTVPCNGRAGHRDPHRVGAVDAPICTWGEDWRYEDPESEGKD